MTNQNELEEHFKLKSKITTWTLSLSGSNDLMFVGVEVADRRGWLLSECRIISRLRSRAVHVSTSRPNRLLRRPVHAAWPQMQRKLDRCTSGMRLCTRSNDRIRDIAMLSVVYSTESVVDVGSLTLQQQEQQHTNEAKECLRQPDNSYEYAHLSSFLTRYWQPKGLWRVLERAVEPRRPS